MYQPDDKYRPAKRLSVAYDILRLPRIARPLRVVGLAVLLLLLAPYAVTLLYSVVDPGSTVMFWRRIAGERVERIYVPLERMSPALPLAVIIAEDGRFCTHHGVDFQEIRDAIADAEDLDDLRGGSTITQQTVKNLFLWPGRSFVRKALEFPLALWIDLVLTKKRVLEIYLNIAEWGPNGEFGIEAGSRRAFGKSARDLSRSQAGLMAAMLPSPAKRDAKAPGPGMRRLGSLYEARAARSPEAASCIR
jgi:monofunctional biosynthetic peptidoglycan transglycosylase